MPWFQRRRTGVEQEQHRLWRQARMKADIQLLISKMSELEIVDSFNSIERHLQGEILVNCSVSSNFFSSNDPHFKEQYANSFFFQSFAIL